MQDVVPQLLAKFALLLERALLLRLPALCAVPKEQQPALLLGDLRLVITPWAEQSRTHKQKCAVGMRWRKELRNWRAPSMQYTAATSACLNERDKKALSHDSRLPNLQARRLQLALNGRKPMPKIYRWCSMAHAWRTCVNKCLTQMRPQQPPQRAVTWGPPAI